MSVDNFDARIDELTEEPIESQPTRDVRTAGGAIDAAVRSLQRSREAMPWADRLDDELRGRMGQRREANEGEIEGYIDAVAREQNGRTAQALADAYNAEVDQEVAALQSRHDVKFFGPDAEREVLMVWRDMFDGRPGQLEAAYRFWEEKVFSDKGIRAAMTGRHDLRTKRGALDIANELAAIRGEREQRYRTPIKSTPLDPRKRSDAMKLAVKSVERSRAR